MISAQTTMNIANNRHNQPTQDAVQTTESKDSPNEMPLQRLSSYIRQSKLNAKPIKLNIGQKNASTTNVSDINAASKACYFMSISSLSKL